MTWLEKRVISVLGLIMALLAVVLLVVLGLRYQASRDRQEQEEALAVYTAVSGKCARGKEVFRRLAEIRARRESLIQGLSEADRSVRHTQEEESALAEEIRKNRDTAAGQFAAELVDRFKSPAFCIAVHNISV